MECFGSDELVDWILKNEPDLQDAEVTAAFGPTASVAAATAFNKTHDQTISKLSGVAVEELFLPALRVFIAIGRTNVHNLAAERAAMEGKVAVLLALASEFKSLGFDDDLDLKPFDIVRSAGFGTIECFEAVRTVAYPLYVDGREKFFPQPTKQDYDVCMENSLYANNVPMIEHLISFFKSNGWALEEGLISELWENSSIQTLIPHITLSTPGYLPTHRLSKEFVQGLLEGANERVEEIVTKSLTRY
ncbi:hypothetical protein BDR26DRAFT_869232 [Obelidium mucronatum]|nr:hypothetical protein BDR26DRAFT_869232 [Obelidium mucronatum]